MATLAVQTIVRPDPGIEQVLSAAAGGGDDFVNTGKEFIIIANDNASPMTLTIPTTSTVDGHAVDDYTATIPANKTHIIGPWPVGIYNDGQSKVAMTYSSVVSLTIGIFKM